MADFPGEVKGGVFFIDDPGPWLATGEHTRCPQCREAEAIYVRVVRAAWEYRCFGCGDHGPAVMKTPQEQGKWADG